MAYTWLGDPGTKAGCTRISPYRHSVSCLWNGTGMAGGTPRANSSAHASAHGRSSRVSGSMIGCIQPCHFSIAASSAPASRTNDTRFMAYLGMADGGR